MALRKGNSRIIWLSLLNTLVMLGIAYYWLSQPRTFGDEAFFIKWSSLVRKSLLGFDAKPAPESVLFIDVSGSKTTIDDPEALSFDPASGYHRKVITDRQHLLQLFELMGRYRQDIDFVICDILFEEATEYDSLLQVAVGRFGENILTVSHLVGKSELVRPAIDVPHALATYRSSSGLFLKFPLVLEDTLKTVPLRMYEQLSGQRLESWGPFYRLGGRLSLPAPIVDFKVRSADFLPAESLHESGFAILPLGTILESAAFMTDEQLGGYFRNKIVLIGDFASDVHATPFGDMPGLLLLYNAYLTLEQGQNLIGPAWILFLIVSFFVLSYRIFADIKLSKPRWLQRLFTSRVGEYLYNALDEMAILVIITLLSYFLFNIHINILVFFIYLKVVEWIWKMWRKRRGSIVSLPTTSPDKGANAAPQSAAAGQQNRNNPPKPIA